MKRPLSTLSTRLTEWLSAPWSTLDGNQPAPPPARRLTPKAAQVAANQEWEDEGGRIERAKKPGLEGGRKIPH